MTVRHALDITLAALAAATGVFHAAVSIVRHRRSSRRNLPAWTGDRNVFLPKFGHIKNTLPDVQAEFLQIIADAEETSQ
jgi:hypothetical protein